MKRCEEQDSLTRLVLYQLKGIRGKNNIDYIRLMRHFDKDSDRKIHNLLSYIQKFPLTKMNTLTDLYRKETIHRQEEYWDNKKTFNFPIQEPYSVEALFNLD